MLLFHRKKWKKMHLTIVVIPTGEKQTQRLLRSISDQKPGCVYEVICPEESAPAAMNAAVLRAQGEYILFLRGNTELMPGWDEKLFPSYLSVDAPGAMGLTCVYPENNKKGIPAGTIREQEVGAHVFLAARKLFDEVGPFDELYCANEAILDFQMRLRLHGYHNFCSEQSRIFLYGMPKETDEEKIREKKKSKEAFRCRWKRYIAEEDSPVKKNAHEIDILGAMPEDDSKKFWGDWHYACALQRELEKRGYRARVVTREHWYDVTSAAVVLVLRGKRRFYPSAAGESRFLMWNISHPKDIDVKEYDLYDHVFFASDRSYQALHAKIKPSSSVLMQCMDDTVMAKYGEEDDPDVAPQGELGPELLFVGNSRRVYRKILKDLLPTEHELQVYGRHWEEFPVQEYVVSDYLANESVGKAYHDAKILLNDHWDDMKEDGIVSNRIFDALAAGAFVISDDMPQIHELFEENVVTYRDREDLREKIDHYLTHETERRQKAKKGRELVLKDHTFARRAEEIIKLLKNKQW